MKTTLLLAAMAAITISACGDDSAPPAPDCAHDKALCDDGPPDTSTTPAGNVAAQAVAPPFELAPLPDDNGAVKSTDKHGAQGEWTPHYGSPQNVTAMQVDYCGNTPCWRRKYPVVYEGMKKDLNQSGRTRFLKTVSYSFGWSQLQSWTNYPTAVWLCVGTSSCVDVTNQSMAGGVRSGTVDVSSWGWSWANGTAIYFSLQVSFGDWGQVSPPKYWPDGVIDGFTYTDGPN